jgi:hypothetical protein
MTIGINYNGRYAVQPGSILAEAKCESCGGLVAVKANKNGAAYYYCVHLDEGLTMCCEKHCWGQRVSMGIRKAFHVAGEKPFKLKFPLNIASSEKLADGLAANDNSAPQKPTLRASNGLFGG